MDILKLNHDIHYSETNALGQLSLPAAFSLMQEAAVRHAAELGIGQEYCDRTGTMWVLSRIDVRLHNNPYYRDLIDIESWTRGAAGPFAIRDYRISAGATLIDGTSSWLLLDTGTMRPRNPLDALKEVPIPGDLRTLPENASRLTESKISGGVERMHSYRPVFSDIDGHNHVNNVQYVRWCLDMLDSEWHHRNRIRTFSINYLRAAGLGDNLVIRLSIEGDTVRFSGSLDSGEKSFLAKMNTEFYDS